MKYIRFEQRNSPTRKESRRHDRLVCATGPANEVVQAIGLLFVYLPRLVLFCEINDSFSVNIPPVLPRPTVRSPPRSSSSLWWIINFRDHKARRRFDTE